MERRTRTQLVAAGLAFLVALASLTGAAEAQSESPSNDITLSMSVVSLTERDGPTGVTVTAVQPDPSPTSTTISLSLQRFPLLTSGVSRGAEPRIDYTADFTRGFITIAPGSLSGTTTVVIDPAYDTRIEGDEAVVLTGSAPGRRVAPTDLIIEDGPYLAFPEYIYGSLHYPGQRVSIDVEEAVNRAAAESTVSYALTRIEPASNPLGLTFDPVTRTLAGTAPTTTEVPAAGVTTRYTITARDSAGHEATTLVSVAVVHDVCGSTAATWFHATERPPKELVVDCNVLLAAKDTLRGAAPLNWARDRDITTWHGLTEFHTDVTWIRKIELQLRGLDGTIPPVLGHLASPGSLDLVLGGDYRETHPALENKLTGPIPPELGLPNLVVLALSFNNLSGPIPRELANAARLHSIYLSETDKPGYSATDPTPPGVSGPIPAEFGDLPLLRNLTITDNPGVNGHIPWQLAKNVSSGDHPGLQVLNLSGNGLEGNVPWQLGHFGKIQQFALSHNQLTGEIPRQLGLLGSEETGVARRVVRLYLNGNSLTGSIPPELGDIANLEVLSLSENWLTGSIPSELGGLSKLRFLYLRDNWLSGGIPPELGDAGGLEELLLYNNRLSGHIPAELGRLEQLRILSLEQNELGGRIPAELGNLAGLAALYLDGNRLEGAIPAELGRLSRPIVLSLSCNALSGAAPASIGAIATLTELNLQGNPALATDAGDRPANLERDGLTTTWTGACRVLPSREYGGSCLRGDVARGFSLLVHAGGSLEGLEECARARGVNALYALREGRYVSWIAGAPGFVNEPFLGLWGPSARGEPAAIPAGTPLIAVSGGPAADPLTGPAVPAWPAEACLRGAIAHGFSLVIYEGGSVGALAACARERGLSAVYVLAGGAWVSYVVGAPDFVNGPFAELFAEGLPPTVPLVVRSDRPAPSATAPGRGSGN